MLALFTVGCGAGTVYNWTVHTKSTPIAASLQPGRLNQDTTAIFTPIASGGLRGSEAGLGQSLGDVMREATPSWKVMEEQQVISLLNRHGLASDYTRMRSDAEQSGILDVALLRKMGQALGARYAFQPRLAFFSQEMTDRFTFPALNIRFSHTRSSLLRLSLQLWDTESGELLWASAAEAELESEGVSQEPVQLDAAARVTLGGMLADFLRRRTASHYTSLDKSLDSLIRLPTPDSEANQGKE